MLKVLKLPDSRVWLWIQHGDVGRLIIKALRDCFVCLFVCGSSQKLPSFLMWVFHPVFHLVFLWAWLHVSISSRVLYLYCICIVFVLYLYCICIVFVLYLYCVFESRKWQTGGTSNGSSVNCRDLWLSLPWTTITSQLSPPSLLLLEQNLPEKSQNVWIYSFWGKYSALSWEDGVGRCKSSKGDYSRLLIHKLGVVCSTSHNRTSP